MKPKKGLALVWITIFILMGNYHVKTTWVKQLDDINVTTLNMASNTNRFSDNNSIQLSISKAVKNTLSANQFDHEITWDGIHLILDESMSFNVSTRLLINNSNIEFAPKNASSHVELIIEEESQLEIYNSTLLLNSSIGRSSITFRGGIVAIVNSILLENGNTAVFVKNSKISIYNSTFDSAGLEIEESNQVTISNCNFQKIKDWGIRAMNSANFSIINNCSFNDIGKIGFVIFNCTEISVKDSRFTNCSEKCVQIDGEYYFDATNIKIENSIMQNSGFGIWTIGQNISILNNSFLNFTFSGVHVGGRNITIENNTFNWVQRGISTPAITETPHIAETGYQWCETSISNVTIQNNSFRNVQQYGIWINNFEFETLFRIEKNILIEIKGAALAFTGNLGGVNSSIRSWVIGNFVKNANYGILGSYTVDCPFGLVFSARFQYTSFIRNAFINCSLNYTSFESDPNNYILND
ncbi:MAG: right-handed parallel beta-helix repeat-containing protein, partial [Candidatus Hodarchaeota archaeon]